MTNLIAQLEGATEGRRELDAKIGVALGFFVTQPNKGWPDKLDYIRVDDEGLCHGQFDMLVPKYTTSVDATIALAERVLPGWKRQLLENFNGKWIARVCSQRRELFSTDYLRETELGGAPNGAIALLIAILKATVTGD